MPAQCKPSASPVASLRPSDCYGGLQSMQSMQSMQQTQQSAAGWSRVKTMSSLCPGDDAVTPGAPKRAAGGNCNAANVKPPDLKLKIVFASPVSLRIPKVCVTSPWSVATQTAVHHHDYLPQTSIDIDVWRQLASRLYSASSSVAVACHSRRTVRRRLKPSHDRVHVFTPKSQVQSPLLATRRVSQRAGT